MQITDSKIVLAIGDDWVGLYIGGLLVYEGHDISNSNLMDVLGIPHEAVYPDDGWLADRGNLPEKLSDVREYRR